MWNGNLTRWKGYVPAHGHRWATRPADGARFLVRNIEQPSEGRNYELFHSYPALFQNFAALYPQGGRWGPKQREDILDFADLYGSLMLDMDWAMADDGTSAIGTPLKSWQREIASLSFAVRIWTLLDAKDEEGLSRCIRLGDDGIAVATWGKVDSPVYRLQTLRELHDAHPFAEGDVLGPARLTLKHVISERLRGGGVNPALEWADSTQQKLAVVVRPDWLHEALWLQFASAVTGGKSYGLCTECGDWFEKKTQREQLFCTNRCKMKAYRVAKKAAERKGETK